MGDVFDKCRNWETYRISRSIGLYPFAPNIQAVHSATEVQIDGRKLIMAGSNDYLALSTDPRVKEAATRAVAEFGTSCSGSRLLNGTRATHLELERRLAAFLRRESAVVLPTGFQTNLATASILSAGDVVLADQENHASLRDAVRLSRAVERVFRHNDMEHLAWLLSDLDSQAGKLIITEGIFSMTGDVCDLPRIVELAGRHGARVMVDCAHDLGVLGAGGRGIPEHFGLESEVDLVMGTFSKSFASLGGVLAGPADVIDYIRHWSTSAVFSAAMTPASAAAALKALDIIETEPERRRRVLDNAAVVRRALRGQGYDVGDSFAAAVPVHVGETMTCLRLWRALYDAGVFTNPVIYPAVAQGRALIRVSVMAAHTDDHLARILEVFHEAGGQLGIIDSPAGGR
jgi:8-amino-7-oxononanoate synthase